MMSIVNFSVILLHRQLVPSDVHPSGFHECRCPLLLCRSLCSIFVRAVTSGQAALLRPSCRGHCLSQCSLVVGTVSHGHISVGAVIFGHVALLKPSCRGQCWSKCPLVIGTVSQGHISVRAVISSHVALLRPSCRGQCWSKCSLVIGTVSQEHVSDWPLSSWWKGRSFSLLCPVPA